MADSPVVDRNYIYSRGGRFWPPEAVDVHDVALRKRRTATRVLLACLFAAALAFRHLFVSQDSTLGGVLWRLIYSAVFFKVMLRRAVVKESVVVMPTFGIQLETHYFSGQVIRRFVPVGKILKPVLVECATPVTCYWILSLVLQDESDLMLVFKVQGQIGQLRLTNESAADFFYNNPVQLFVQLFVRILFSFTFSSLVFSAVFPSEFKF